MSRIKKYRKKPVVVEAIQVSWRNWNALCDFIPSVALDQNLARRSLSYSDTCGEPGPEYIELLIPTPEGIMTARHGDYIVKGVNGEFYPIKPDIFAATYEEVVE
jgi:hypothetical protein